ncbi:acyl-[acyl-carrier-protein] thioesterase [Haloimpatiens sp. FM7315]|uniref:acyl-[acyl-carrier-protein] thioesterase n=1 Tax=Haloimpatiens sp. FM7315 TaxID=3298609 RepID=UPI0035A3CE28
MEGLVTEREYTVHYYEIDYKRRALITSIMDFLGDVAMVQTEESSIDLDFLQKNKIAWVLYKWDIKIERYPHYREKIKVRTYAYGMKKYYAYRKFEIIDADENVIVTAVSIWFLLDIEKRKPITIPDYMYDIYKIDKSEKKSLKIDKIKKLEKIDEENKFTVRYGDIDTNKHVNNVKYVSWAIETVPKEIVTNYELKGLKVVYEKETTYGNIIKVRTEVINEDEKLVCIHKIEDKNGNELATLETEWGR